MDQEALKKDYLAIILGFLAGGVERTSRELNAIAERLSPYHKRGVFYVTLIQTKGFQLTSYRQEGEGQDGKIVTSHFRITQRGLEVLDAILACQPVTASGEKEETTDGPRVLN